MEVEYGSTIMFINLHAHKQPVFFFIFSVRCFTFVNQENGNPHSFAHEEPFSIKSTEFVIGGIMLSARIRLNFTI